MLRKFKRTAGFFLLLIFTTYYVNITFFHHSHIINGVTIVHSHFHNKAHTQTGTHSSSELTLISILSAFSSLLPVLCLVSLGLYSLLKKVNQVVADKIFFSTPPICYSLRAPPFHYWYLFAEKISGLIFIDDAFLIPISC